MIELAPRSESSNQGTNAPTQNNPCCTFNLCCGKKGSWRDIIMFTVEGGSGTASVVSLVLTQNFYLGGGLVALTIATGIVHCLWRRDAVVADLHRVVVDIGSTDNKLDGTIEKTDEVADKLRKENETLIKEKEALLNAKQGLERDTFDLSNNIELLQLKNIRLGSENKNLEEQNNLLKGQISRLQNIIKSIKEHLARFNEQNNAFKGNIGKLDSAVSEFGKEDHSLQDVLSGIDKDLGSDILQLTQEVSKAQNTSEEIFKLFSNQIQSLKEEIKSLQPTISNLNKDEDTIQKRSQELAILEQKNLEAEKALQKRQEEFEKINQQLAVAKLDLAEALKKYEQTEGKFSIDTTGLKNTTAQLVDIAEHLDKLGNRLEEDVDELKKIKGTTKKQEEEIDQV